MSIRALHTSVYDALCSFPQAAQFSSLAHAQVRNLLADHLTGVLHHDGWVRTEEKATDVQSATATPDTLNAWLYQRFINAPDAPAWDALDDDDRSYWGHQARAVRRAVARGGFKPEAGDCW